MQRILEVAAALLLAPAWSLAATPADPCQLIRDIVERDGTLGVTRCEPLGERFVDIRWDAGQMPRCDLNGTRVVTEFIEGQQTNSQITITDGAGASRTVTPHPQTALATKLMQTRPRMVCQPQGRIFYAHPVLGYVAAYNLVGSQVWRTELPNYTPLDRILDVKSASISEIMERFGSEDVSVLLRLARSGSYLAVSWRQGPRSIYYAFIHESGRVIAQIGPWDAVLVDGGERGFRFVVNGGGDIRTYTPTHEIDVRVQDDRLTRLLQHGLAWFEPRPISKSFELGCANRSEDELRHWLGPDYRADVARISKQIFTAYYSGGKWTELASTQTMAEVIRAYHPTSSTWRSDYRSALFALGADAQLASLISEEDLAAVPWRPAGSPTRASGRDQDRPIPSPATSVPTDILKVPITVSFANTDLPTALELLAKASGVTIVRSGDCKGIVTVGTRSTLGELLEMMAISANAQFAVVSQNTVAFKCPASMTQETPVTARQP